MHNVISDENKFMLFFWPAHCLKENLPFASVASSPQHVCKKPLNVRKWLQTVYLERLKIFSCAFLLCRPSMLKFKEQLTLTFKFPKNELKERWINSVKIHIIGELRPTTSNVLSCDHFTAGSLENGALISLFLLRCFIYLFSFSFHPVILCRISLMWEFINLIDANLTDNSKVRKIFHI